MTFFLSFFVCVQMHCMRVSVVYNGDRFTLLLHFRLVLISLTNDHADTEPMLVFGMIQMPANGQREW